MIAHPLCAPGPQHAESRGAASILLGIRRTIAFADNENTINLKM